MGIWTVVLVISLFGLSRLPDASNRILIFSNSTWHFRCSCFRGYCGSSSEAIVLPSVSTILFTKPSCTVNEELTTVLSSAGPGISSPVDSSPVVVSPTPRVVAASSDSESQEGETDPPPRESPVGRFCCW